MTSWLFDATDEGWSVGVNPMTWNAVEGEPDVGCLSKTIADASFAAEAYKDSLSIAVLLGDNISFHRRHVWTAENDAFDLTVTAYVTIDAVEYTVITQTYGITIGSGDSGWNTLSGTMPVAGTLSKVRIRQAATFLLSAGMTVYLDSVYVVDTEAPPTFGTTELRYLGMAADSHNLYLTGLGDGTLGFLVYNQITLGLLSTHTFFGTASFADVDAGVYGLYPAVKPYSLSVYAYGRDGNSKQVRYLDQGGTLGWQDIGPGTATWGTAKFTVALLPDPLKFDDLIVVFSDNDVYRTVLGTAGWVKQGDATTEVRTAGRVFPVASNLLLAGTAAGTLLWSGNYGVSYTSGGTAAGTINAIEVSR